MDKRLLEEQKKYLEKLKEQKRFVQENSARKGGEINPPQNTFEDSRERKKTLPATPSIPEEFARGNFKNIEEENFEDDFSMDDLEKIKQNFKQRIGQKQIEKNKRTMKQSEKEDFKENRELPEENIETNFGNFAEYQDEEDDENRKILERTMIKPRHKSDENPYNNPMHVAKRIIEKSNQAEENNIFNKRRLAEQESDISSHAYVQTSNPLARHFRKPGISIRLPSNLLYYKRGEVLVVPNGEVEIYPLTLKDEIQLKNPDGLNSGASLYRIVQSCCPGIRNPDSLLNPDLDAILIGIRICSYGRIMEIETKCPKCNAENAYGIDLQDLLDTAYIMDEIPVLQIDNLAVYIKPYSLRSNLKISDFTFEQAKLINLASKDETPEEEKIKIIDTLSQKIIELQESLISDSIYFIETEDGVKVDNRDHILEWVKNAPSSHIREIENFILEMNKKIGIKKEFDLTCKECKNTWKTNLTYDPTSFFKKN